ncbi:MAG: 23S rRNA pseudouridine(1911/1915/1917) synthase RluD [Woeseia sp.]|nr:23S rRNA pseudouridine(1911/1915/1917) synthase RluD [Woeseia sp.]MBT8096047.1 23S rRNA pseudouridine(1911/1915/1917) synthase RluD [Woeseia sp.]NNE61483.1 23S rRNA pseudouridine(1911/1915/1917) synthase RluD [Woeseia sp.]NNL54466.1 23S rRNA pseudouridine(1911/1915/1917) synthase RluD [Woeseia sp.]
MDESPLQQTIPAELAGSRLDQALARMFPDYSRSRLTQWLKKGLVSVDGGSRRPRDTVLGGESVIVRPEAERAVTSRPEPIALDVVFEDDELLVIDKPAGLVVHPGAGNPHGTLMNGLLHHAPGLAELPRAGIVHRLDKDTSGLLLVGKTLLAHTALTRALAEREIARHYQAICLGRLTAGGTIDAPISRHPVDRLRMSVQAAGKPAITHFRVLRRFVAHTHVSVKLETGRTHQIRVHFAHRRNPLVGDPVYGGRLALPPGTGETLANMLRTFRRQALCATRLELQHPGSAEQLEFEVSPPADFMELLTALDQHAQAADEHA